MSKKIIVFIIVFVALAGVMLTGIFGANPVTVSPVLATNLYFEGEGLSDFVTSTGVWKKLDKLPDFDQNHETAINLLDYLKLEGDTERGLPPTKGIESLSIRLIVDDAYKDKVFLTLGFTLVFTEVVNVKVVVKTTDGSKTHDGKDLTAYLYFRNDPDGKEPIDISDDI